MYPQCNYVKNSMSGPSHSLSNWLVLVQLCLWLFSSTILIKQMVPVIVQFDKSNLYWTTIKQIKALSYILWNINFLVFALRKSCLSLTFLDITIPFRSLFDPTVYAVAFFL